MHSWLSKGCYTIISRQNKSLVKCKIYFLVVIIHFCFPGGFLLLCKYCIFIFKYCITKPNHHFNSELRSPMNSFPGPAVPQFLHESFCSTELFSYYHLFCLGTSCGVRTKNGNAYGGCCVFPFKYNGVMHYTCTYLDHNMPWCSITMNFDRDGVWGECIGTCD